MNKSLFINIYQALLHVAENLSTILNRVRLSSLQ